jgi:hypothetical protein
MRKDSLAFMNKFLHITPSSFQSEGIWGSQISFFSIVDSTPGAQLVFGMTASASG